MRRRRETGDYSSKPPGGDIRSYRIEARRAHILAVWETCKDFSLEELRRVLIEIGLSVFVAALHRFFVRHGIMRKICLIRIGIGDEREQFLERREIIMAHGGGNHRLDPVVAGNIGLIGLAHDIAPLQGILTVPRQSLPPVGNLGGALFRFLEQGF